MPNTPNLTPIGQVLGASTAVAAGAEVLPRTGMEGWTFILALLAIVAGGVVLASFVLTRLLRRIL